MQLGEQVTYTLITKPNKAIIKITDTQNNTIIHGDKTLKKQLTTQKNKKTNNTHTATITEINTTTINNNHTTITHLTIEEYTPDKHKTITIRPDRLIIQTRRICPQYKRYGSVVFRNGNNFWGERLVYVFVGGVTEEVVQELC